MVGIIIFLLGISGFFIPLILLIILFQPFFIIYGTHKKMSAKLSYEIVSLFVSISLLIVNILTAYFIYTQALVAKEGTMPNVVVWSFNDEERRGIYAMNVGKGNAIIDNIEINGKSYNIVQEDDWKQILKDIDIHSGINCFAFSPIQSHVVLNSGDTELLIGQRKAVLKQLQEITKDMQIDTLNKLVLSELAQSDKISGIEIVKKYDEIMPNNIKSNNLDEGCKITDDEWSKLGRLPITISYYSIIDDKKVKSIRLKNANE